MMHWTNTLFSNSKHDVVDFDGRNSNKIKQLIGVYPSFYKKLQNKKLNLG
jgi:hypothetical protein